MKSKITKIGFFYRPAETKAKLWRSKIQKWLSQNLPGVKIVDKGYRALIVLGGDGAILEAARTCQQNQALIIGLNLGTVGFLASVRSPKDFLPSLTRLFQGAYSVTKRAALQAEIKRAGRSVHSATALNEIIITNPLGMVEVKTFVDGQPVQDIRGTGVMLATATGSTAYNLSAHGPIVMPDAHNFILTELLDHNTPTPSLVLRDSQKISIQVANFRKRELLSITASGQRVDILFIADGEVIYPLQKGDRVEIKRAPFHVKFAEFEKNYFLKSLKQKFYFR